MRQIEAAGNHRALVGAMVAVKMDDTTEEWRDSEGRYKGTPRLMGTQLGSASH
jgi:hypothetical protein